MRDQIGRAKNSMKMCRNIHHKITQPFSYKSISGPLIMRRFGRSAIVGIVSWGMDCGSQTYPGVYARVYQQMAWIKETIPKSEMCA